MTVELTPEMESLIQRRLKSGAFSTPEEVVERALEFLNEEEDWIAAHRDEIASKIQEGWDEAERGELTDSVQVQAEMRQFKEDWKNHGRRA